ncbi:phospholipase A and acyltransferase 4 [Pleuronectes platessa]|uniref:phospholipase A and acyltransferase 4 n=1 Tax=Pleuronectes platessa TaxID=8262 RepID=UPI00232A281F|nr:phospholipase A and acyltransferase 4 [Pleuronectes platessa]
MAQTFNGKPGDLIVINRLAYHHWAIYIGENEVVHLDPEGGDSSSSLELLSFRGEVKRQKLTDLVANDTYQVKNLLDQRYRARDHYVIVKEASAMVGRQLSYNDDTYNSEHFARDLRYGEAESRQVRRAACPAWAGLAAARAATNDFSDRRLLYRSLKRLSKKSDYD